MPLQKRVQNAYLFDNGNLAAFDLGGQQIPELQGPYSIGTHKRILLEARDDCKFQGFGILPRGFHKHASDWADYFRERNLSFEEINDL